MAGKTTVELTDIEDRVLKIMGTQAEAREPLWLDLHHKPAVERHCTLLLDALRNASCHPGETLQFNLADTDGIRLALDLQDDLYAASPALSLSYPNVRHACIVTLLEEIFRFKYKDFWKTIDPSLGRRFLSWALCRVGLHAELSTLGGRLCIGWKIYEALRETGPLNIVCVRCTADVIKRMPNRLLCEIMEEVPGSVVQHPFQWSLRTFLRKVRISCFNDISRIEEMSTALEECLSSWPEDLMDEGFPEAGTIGKHPFHALDRLWELHGIPYTKRPWGTNESTKIFKKALSEFIVQGDAMGPVRVDSATPWQISWLRDVSHMWLNRALDFEALNALLELLR